MSLTPKSYILNSSRNSFTLMELLLVIGILAILSVGVVVVLNPLEYLKQARDSTRISDLNTLNKSLSIYDVQVGGSMGTSSIVYISIADTSATCANLGLPTLPAGWTYSCVTSDNLTKTDGTGWLPVNFSSLTIGSPIEKLPIDPVNTTSTGQYYTYSTGGSYELTAALESETKHAIAIGDGGSLPGVYEVGTDISLTPGTRDLGLVGWWKFDEGTGTTAYDASGKNNTGTLINSPTWITADSCKSGACLNFGTNQAVRITDNNSLDIPNNLTISMWIKPVALTSSITSHLFYKWGGTSDANYVLYYCGVSCGSGNYLRYYANRGGSWSTISNSSPTLSTDTWYFIAFTYSSGGQWYWDGATYSTKYSGGILTTNSASLYIGNDSLTGNTFIIDDVRIYNRALSATEIQAIYNATN